MLLFFAVSLASVQRQHAKKVTKCLAYSFMASAGVGRMGPIPITCLEMRQKKNASWICNTVETKLHGSTVMSPQSKRVSA